MRRRRLIGGSKFRSLVFALGGSWRSEIAARAAAFFPRASLNSEVVSRARFSLNPVPKKKYPPSSPGTQFGRRPALTPLGGDLST